MTQAVTRSSPGGGPSLPTGSGRRLRIAYVYDALFPHATGGAERRIHELATRLAPRHDVHLVSWSYWGTDPTFVRDGITHHGVGQPRPFYGADGKRTVSEAVTFALRALPVVRSLDVDVIDVSATPYVPLFTTWLGARLAGAPLVVTWHEYWGDHWREYLPGRPVVARLARSLEAVGGHIGDRRVAVSRLTATRLAGPGRDGRHSVAVVGNGVDVERLTSAEPDAVASDVIHVGRLIDEKRVDVLLRAIAALERRFPALRCVIVGDGPERERLEHLAAALGLGSRVRFLGAVPDARVGRLLAASRILALPSRREGFGIVVAEAQAAGLVPVVAAGPLSAAADLVRDGVDGLVFDGSVDGLAASLGRLLGDVALRGRLAAEAALAARRWSWDDRAGEMEAIYFGVARTRAPSAAAESSPTAASSPAAASPAAALDPTSLDAA